MKIASSAIITVGGIASCGAFLSPGGKPSLRLRPGFDQQFQPSSLRDNRPAAASPRGDVSVGLFRDLLKKFKGDDDDEKENKEKVEPASSSTSNDEGKADAESVGATSASGEEAATPFFAADSAADEVAEVAEATPIESKEEEVAVEAQEEVVIEAKEEVVEPKKEEPKVELSPMSQAEQLRAQAARIRLEADKRQVELTLEKIDKLNTKLESLKKKDVVNEKDQQSLEEELQRLKSQLIQDETGELKLVPAPVVAAKTEAATTDTSSTRSNKDDSSSSASSRPTLSAEDMEARVKQFEEAPEFMKKLVAKTIGFGVDDDTPGAVDRLNATDIVQKLYDDEMDYQNIASDFATDSEQTRAREMIERAYKKSKDMDDDNDNDKPTFTKEQIDAKIEELNDIPDIIKGLLYKDFNNTEVALLLLEQEWEDEQNKKKIGGLFDIFGNDKKEPKKGEIGMDGERMDKENPGTFSRLFGSDDSSSSGKRGNSLNGEPDLDFMMESLYPASTRKEDETPDRKQVDTFMNTVVAPTRAFTPSSNPISVPGGWIIRGKNECETGDELINKLDMSIARDARLRKEISFFILKDPFPDPEETMLDPLNWPQVLFVAGPNVARDSEPILRSVVSAIAIATVWYGSLAPFLANSKLLDRATEAMELADAGMPSDLAWLTDMSIPLFFTFFVLQASHELAHWNVARQKNFEITTPTFVPSIMSGITSSITSLRTSPKDRQDLLEFAVAGPLAGMLGSIFVLCYGLVLTANADAATVASYPGLPLAILRSSSLGGGLIDLFLGNGVLNVPASAEAAQALASTLIALHPLAVAGFISLVVNAVALVPVGRTDGGRTSMALFGRSASQAVTFMSLAFLFFFGLQNDLLLFYFAFVVFFQSELEIPMRNEVDSPQFTGFALASFAWIIMLLTLIPM